MKAEIEFIELRLTEAERAAFLERVRSVVGPEDYCLIEGMTNALPRLIELIEQTPTVSKLRRLVFGPKTEKTRQVLPAASSTASANSEPTTSAGSTQPESTTTAGSRSKAKGHGRTKARDYTGASWVSVPHPQLQAGAACPTCGQGAVRKQKSPAVILRIEGAPPISATGYELERWRCDTCGEVFTAPTPPEAGSEKFAPSVGVTVAMLRYGSGVPHYRLAKLQKMLGVPMPASTQWEVMQPLAQQAQPVLEELITQAAQSPLVHHDDTPMRILDLRRPGSATAAQVDPQRMGTFTTNVVAYIEDHPVALYFTGWKHAGENLADVLSRREASLPPPIQMCDALSRNFSPEFEIDPRPLLRAWPSGICDRRGGLSPRVSLRARIVGGSLPRGRRGQRPSHDSRAAIGPSSNPQSACHGTAPGLDAGTDRRQARRAQLWVGPGHRLHAPALGTADVVPPPSRGPFG